MFGINLEKIRVEIGPKKHFPIFYFVYNLSAILITSFLSSLFNESFKHYTSISCHFSVKHERLSFISLN